MLLDKISPRVNTLETVFSVTSSIVEIASRISSSWFNVSFKKLFRELWPSRLDRLLITSRCLSSILINTLSVDFPLRMRHSWRRLVIPPSAETTIKILSSWLLFKIDITLDIDSESATDVPPNFMTFKKLSLFY